MPLACGMSGNDAEPLGSPDAVDAPAEGVVEALGIDGGEGGVLDGGEGVGKGGGGTVATGGKGGGFSWS